MRFNSPVGSYATFMEVIDGAAGPMRDTISYFTNLLNSWNLSNICLDNRRWFGFSSQEWGALQKLYRFARASRTPTGASTAIARESSR